MALASVTDGDTVDVVLDGRLESVRLVGVDAPETGGPYRERECFGPEGTAFLEWLLSFEGELFIEQDVEDRDRYGRLLRWVWLDLGGGEVYLLNEAVIRAGLGERFRDTPNRRYVDELIAAEEFARFYGLGLWGACETGFAARLRRAAAEPARRRSRSARLRPTATRPTPTFASRRRLRICRAATCRTRGSACSHPTRTTSTATGTGWRARGRGSRFREQSWLVRAESDGAAACPQSLGRRRRRPGPCARANHLPGCWRIKGPRRWSR